MIQFDVLGIPAPQGSKTAFVRNGRAVIVEGSSTKGRKAVAAWRDAVAEAASDAAAAHGAALDEPVALRIDFRLPMPVSDRYRTRHDRQPDCDKLLRSTFDSLTMGGLIVDDARICEVHATKRYTSGAPGACITVMPLGESEASDRERLKAAARGARGVVHEANTA